MRLVWPWSVRLIVAPQGVTAEAYSSTPHKGATETGPPRGGEKVCDPRSD